jgi:hypothetical protein
MQTLTEILLVGSNKPIMDTIARLVNTTGKWKATIAYSPGEALEAVKTKEVKVVLLCAGIDNEQFLFEELKNLFPQLPVVKHYGGGSGLLYAELYEALALI